MKNTPIGPSAGQKTAPKQKSITANKGVPELTATQQERFKELDATVKEFANQVLRAGTALAEINNSRLYRGEHKTFEAYCRSVHDYSRSYAYGLINAAETVKQMSTIADKHSLTIEQIPQKESQLRVLAKVPDADEKCRILTEVIKEKGDTFTANDIREKVNPQKSEDDNRPPPYAVRIERAKQQVLVFKKEYKEQVPLYPLSDIQMILNTIMEFLEGEA